MTLELLEKANRLLKEVKGINKILNDEGTALLEHILIDDIATVACYIVEKEFIEILKNKRDKLLKELEEL